MTRVIIVKRFETVYDSIKRYISIAIIISGTETGKVSETGTRSS